MAEIHHPDVVFTDGTRFRSMTQGESIPEIYGWLERDFAIVPKSSGWWRTQDHVEAARRAGANFHLGAPLS